MSEAEFTGAKYEVGLYATNQSTSVENAEAALELAPDREWLRGDKTPLGEVRKRSTAAFLSGLPRNAPLHQQIETLLTRLPDDVANVFERLRNYDPPTTSRFEITSFIDNPQASVTIDPEQLRKIVALGLPLLLRNYLVLLVGDSSRGPGESLLGAMRDAEFNGAALYEVALYVWSERMSVEHMHGALMRAPDLAWLRGEELPVGGKRDLSTAAFLSNCPKTALLEEHIATLLSRLRNDTGRRLERMRDLKKPASSRFQITCFVHEPESALRIETQELQRILELRTPLYIQNYVIQEEE